MPTSPSQDPIQDAINQFFDQVGNSDDINSSTISDAFHDAANGFLESLAPEGFPEFSSEDTVVAA